MKYVLEPVRSILKLDEQIVVIIKYTIETKKLYYISIGRQKFTVLLKKGIMQFFNDEEFVNVNEYLIHSWNVRVKKTTDKLHPFNNPKNKINTLFPKKIISLKETKFTGTLGTLIKCLTL